jgi:hypothetical protein
MPQVTPFALSAKEYQDHEYYDQACLAKAEAQRVTNTNEK